MEKLDRFERMLIKGCIRSEIRQLEELNAEIDRKTLPSDIDLVNYAYNKDYIEKYKKILEKIS